MNVSAHDLFLSPADLPKYRTNSSVHRRTILLTIFQPAGCSRLGSFRLPRQSLVEQVNPTICSTSALVGEKSKPGSSPNRYVSPTDRASSRQSYFQAPLSDSPSFLQPSITSQSPRNDMQNIAVSSANIHSHLSQSRVDDLSFCPALKESWQARHPPRTQHRQLCYYPSC